MFDWITGSNKQKEETKTEKKLVAQISKQDQWAYDFIKQYLISPIWRNPLLDFIEQNCLIFDDSDQNKFEYTKIHQQFLQLCTFLLESITSETGISETLLQQCIFKGITNKKDQKIFQQVLLCDNFLAFKKIMVAKNKQLQIAAVNAQNTRKGIKTTPAQQKINEKQLERLQIEKAIALSLAMEDKIKQQQQKELEEAIRLSQIQAQNEQKKKSQIKPSSAATNLSSLPPLVIGSNRPAVSITQIKEEEKTLIKQIETLKVSEDKKEQQNNEDRKKRLLEQRELIRKKKMQERQQQLNNFVQNKSTSSTVEASKVSEEELERRKKLMQRLKEQLKE